MKSIFTITILLALTVAPSIAQQLGDLSGRNLILNDGGAAGATKNTITLAPQDATTQTANYTILLPSGPAPAVNAVLQVTSVIGPIATLSWTVAPTLNIPLVYEEAAPGDLNIRRRTAFISGVQGVPGRASFDGQAARALATQTASGDYAGILIGENNTASSDYSLVLGGSGHTASGTYALIGGGNTNTASGAAATVLNGANNVASGDGALILNGSGNAVSGDLSAILSGRNNTVSGDASVVVSGGGHTVAGGSSVVLGGRGLTVPSDNTLAWSGTLAAYSITASGSAVINNANLVLTNSNGTGSRLVLLEPSAAASFPTAGENFIAFQAGIMAADNVYTLPTAVGSVGQVLRITTVAGTNAETQWTNDLGGPVIQDVIVGGATGININANVTYLRITSNVAPGVAPVTFIPPALYADGTILVVRVIGAAPANGVSFIDGAGGANEFVLSGNFQPQNNDTITFVWDATTTSWIELSRRNN